jgi:hypothetical protein
MTIHMESAREIWGCAFSLRYELTFLVAGRLYPVRSADISLPTSKVRDLGTSAMPACLGAQRGLGANDINRI